MPDLNQTVSGVPHRPVLGPQLFFILINNINEKVSGSFVFSFARIGYLIGNPDDITKMQFDLNSIFKKADQNNMKFNIDKLECVKYPEMKSSSIFPNTRAKVTNS